MTGGLYLGISIVALALFISILWWVLVYSRRPNSIPVTQAPFLPSGQNHHWIDRFDYKLSDFLPVPPESIAVSSDKTEIQTEQKKAALPLKNNGEEEELQQLAAAELDAEAAHYAARAEAEAQPPQLPAAGLETYDFPFDAPAPTATDKHNTTVKNELRARRAAIAKSSRLVNTGNVLTKSQPA